MRRRGFFTRLGGAAIVYPVVARRLIKGKPSEIPVERPASFRLVL
jgi:hypothetical protein